MKHTSRIEAQQRADDIRIFRKELDRLETEGVLKLADGQRAAVRAHHDGLLAGFAQAFDIDRDVRSKQLSWGMRIASFLGALALAASVFFLFYQFWGRFTETAQVAILIGASLGMFAITVWIQGRDATGYFTKLAAMVAFACFVLNVAMLGQIFNITPSDKALLPWAALALLLAYACDLRLLLAAGIICIVVYTAARFGTWSGMYWIHFGERPENFFPVSLLLFFLPQLVNHRRREDFAPVYRVFAILSLLLPVLILSNWGDISYLNWPCVRGGIFLPVIGFRNQRSAGLDGVAAAVARGGEYWRHLLRHLSLYQVLRLVVGVFPEISFLPGDRAHCGAVPVHHKTHAPGCNNRPAHKGEGS